MGSGVRAVRGEGLVWGVAGAVSISWVRLRQPWASPSASAAARHTVLESRSSFVACVGAAGKWVEGGFPRWVEDLLQDASNDGLDTNGVRMEAAVLQAYFLAVVGGV